MVSILQGRAALLSEARVRTTARPRTSSDSSIASAAPSSSIHVPIIGVQCAQDPSRDVKLVPLNKVRTFAAIKSIIRELYDEVHGPNCVKVMLEREGLSIYELFWGECLVDRELYTVSFVPAVQLTVVPVFPPTHDVHETLKVEHTASIWHVRRMIQRTIGCLPSYVPPLDNLLMLRRLPAPTGPQDDKLIELQDHEHVSLHFDLGAKSCRIEVFWNNMPVLGDMEKTEWFAANPAGLTCLEALKSRAESQEL